MLTLYLKLELENFINTELIYKNIRLNSEEPLIKWLSSKLGLKGKEYTRLSKLVYHFR